MWSGVVHSLSNRVVFYSRPGWDYGGALLARRRRWDIEGELWGTQWDLHYRSTLKRESLDKIDHYHWCPRPVSGLDPHVLWKQCFTSQREFWKTGFRYQWRGDLFRSVWERCFRYNADVKWGWGEVAEQGSWIQWNLWRGHWVYQSQSDDDFAHDGRPFREKHNPARISNGYFLPDMGVEYRKGVRMERWWGGRNFVRLIRCDISHFLQGGARTGFTQGRDWRDLVRAELNLRERLVY